MREETLIGEEEVTTAMRTGQRNEQWHNHTAAVSVCAALLKEVSLGLIRTAANARPTVFFFSFFFVSLFLIDSLSLSTYCVLISPSLSLFLWGGTPSVTLPCNRGHFPTFVSASITETNRYDERQRPISCCLNPNCINFPFFFFFFKGKMTEVQMNRFLIMCCQNWIA